MQLWWMGGGRLVYGAGLGLGIAWIGFPAKLFVGLLLERFVIMI